MVAALTRLDGKTVEMLRRNLQARNGMLRTTIAWRLRESGQAHEMQVAEKLRDPEAESLADILAEVEYAEVQNEVRELRDVDAALKRIQAGSYGVCADCGAAIPVARLRAYPVAKRCLACQQLHEDKTRGVLRQAG